MKNVKLSILHTDDCPNRSMVLLLVTLHHGAISNCYIWYDQIVDIVIHFKKSPPHTGLWWDLILDSKCFERKHNTFLIPQQIYSFNINDCFLTVLLNLFFRHKEIIEWGLVGFTEGFFFYSSYSSLPLGLFSGNCVWIVFLTDVLFDMWLATKQNSLNK